MSFCFYRSNHPLSVGDTTSPTASFQPHIDQSRPSRKDEEDLQLQLALRMSKEQAEEEDKLRWREQRSVCVNKINKSMMTFTL